MSRIIQIVIACALVLPGAVASAQDDDPSLGDLARAARKSKAADPQKPEEEVIDNDNFDSVLNHAEIARARAQPVFSIDPSGKTFRMTSPDGVCSLSFDAKATSLISTPYVATDLPQDELLKLAGPAAIHDDILEVLVHNGTGWELKEIVVGITVLQPSAVAEVRPGNLIPAGELDPIAKQPDLTVLYHMKGVALPDSVATYRASLGESFADTKDWHWAIVSARGVPPASTVPTQSSTISAEGPGNIPSSEIVQQPGAAQTLSSPAIPPPNAVAPQPQ
jgi:hypothetical protein